MTTQGVMFVLRVPAQTEVTDFFELDSSASLCQWGFRRWGGGGEGGSATHEGLPGHNLVCMPDVAADPLLWADNTDRLSAKQSSG